MKPQRYQQIDRLFEAALDLEASERAKFLENACGDDHDLRTAVENLLIARGRADSFLSVPALETVARSLAEPSSEFVAGDTIGPYEILAWIGAGGMGQVYRARDQRLDRGVVAGRNLA